jgi:HSP20 family protein
MLTTRWEPFVQSPLAQFQKEMNRLFETFGTTNQASPTLAYSYPPVNIWEDADHIYVEAELPGMEQNQLQIFVTNGNQLTIQGERQVNETPKGIWHRQERGYGKFSRVITLPVAANADTVQARLEFGVLNVTLPKSAQARPKRIKVKAE